MKLPALNDVSRMRLRAFKARKTAYWSMLILVGLFTISLFSEVLANNRPLVAWTQGTLYFPVFADPPAARLNLKGTLVVDWRELQKKWETEPESTSWAFWPLIPWGPHESDSALESFPSSPSSTHLLGSDDKGRDLLVRLVYGFRLSMVYALSVWILSFAFGVSWGAVQGFFGGRMDFFGQRFSEIWSAIPVFFMLLTLIALFTPSLTMLIILSSVFGWTAIAQYSRAEFLNLRRRDFVEAARALGASNRRIMFRHILPNALTPVVTFTPFTIAGGITGIAALDYLGFGVPPPTPSWGELLRQALTHFSTAWWITTYTVGSMFFVLLMLVFINEGVRHAFDPRKQ